MNVRTRLVAVAFLLSVSAASAGCSPAVTAPTASPAPPASAMPSFDATVGTKVPRAATVPRRPDLRTPESAVRSYLDWISYAYRVGESDLASSAADPYEMVRVDSYVQLNLESGRAIHQVLRDLEVKSVRAREHTATVAVTESWRYRYIDIKAGAYSSPVYSVTYDSTYTVVETAGAWLVSRVQATPQGGKPK